MVWTRWTNDAEAQFNPQANRASEANAEFKIRSILSQKARDRMDCNLDIRYGPGPRQLLDIFPIKNSTGKEPIHIHIHGGYFRMGHKANTSYFAEPFVNAGISCVIPTYDLCPDVSLEELVNQALSAIEWVHLHGAKFGDPNRIYLSGTSAGAYLCAMALGYDWSMKGLPPNFIRGASLLTGIYDLNPLLAISVNELVGLTQERANDLSPIYHLPRHPVPLIMTVGEKEPPGWQEQTWEFAEICRKAGCTVDEQLALEETHFSIGRSIVEKSDHPIRKKMIAQMLNPQF